MNRIISFLICLIGVLLPCKLRVLFSEFLGWILQFFYYIYSSLMKFLIHHLKIDKKDKNTG
ncbi:MAG: hypothetical protein KJ736_07410 [Candidatus Omnitrophica bacterium]|nr:hypothetical protein [Candidatus Omnitrophota bacterium]